MESSPPTHPRSTSYMEIVYVQVRVMPEWVDRFMEATVANARRSMEEPGVARFDVLQAVDNPTHFVLMEAYLTGEDAVAHKETEHYQLWRDAVAPMMAEPRSSVKYVNIFPHSESW